MPHVVTEIRSMHGVRARISAAHTTSQSVRSTRFCTLAAQQTVAWRIEISRCVQVAMFAFILKHGVYRQKWKPRNGPPADARAFNNVRVASFCMKAMQTRTKWPLSSTIYVLCAAGTRVFFFLGKMADWALYVLGRRIGPPPNRRKQITQDTQAKPT